MNAECWVAGNEASTPDEAIAKLRARLGGAAFTDWTVSDEDEVRVDRYGAGFQAVVRLTREIEPVKLCPHGKATKDCVTCTPF